MLSGSLRKCYAVLRHSTAGGSADYHARRLVANLSKAEKSTLFTNGASGVERIHWPKYNWWSEALHGVARDGLGTSFPQIGLVAASYNRTLWHAIGDVTSTEGRGKNNKLQGNIYQGLTFWAPNVNIFRDRASCPKHDECHTGSCSNAQARTPTSE